MSDLRPSAEAPVVVVHEATGLYLAPGLVLGDLDDAVVFDDRARAEAFLARHGSEPCLVPVLPAVAAA
jgi:hypothetical protein